MLKQWKTPILAVLAMILFMLAVALVSQYVIFREQVRVTARVTLDAIMREAATEVSMTLTAEMP